MKGPHFFEKRKKEMARQEKLKQKADRKAQRRAEKGKEGDDPAADDAEFSDSEGLAAGIEGAEAGDTEGQIETGETPSGGPSPSDRAPLGSDGQVRGS